MHSFLEYRDVTMRYHALAGETKVMERFSLRAEEGEFIAIVGPSGCGKSTLLSLAAGLVFPDSGGVLFQGETVTKPPQDIGYMLQRDELFPWLSIYENARLGLRVQGDKTREALGRVEELLTTTGLLDVRDHFPAQLSGGMRQRAALVRTLAVRPRLLLLDEPFSALDSQTRLKISDEVWRTLQGRGCTSLLVTHDISEAVAMATRVVVLSRRPTRIIGEHDIPMQGSPLERRDDPLFKEYFNTVWKELDIHVA